MRKFFGFACLSVVLLCCQSLFAQAPSSTPPLGARLKAHWKGATAILTEYAVSHEIEIGGYLGISEIQQLKLLGSKEKNDFIYLLLDVSSKSTETGGQCGVGTDLNLLWLKLDPSWRVQDHKSVLHQSCWQDTDTKDDGTTTSELRWVVSEPDATKTVRYRFSFPEQGLQIQGKPE